MTNINLFFAVGSIILASIWFLVTRYFGGRSILNRFPRFIAWMELILAPIIVAMIGMLGEFLLGMFGQSQHEANLKLLISAMMCLVIAHFAIRLLETWLLSKDKFHTLDTLPALQSGLLYGSAYFISFSVFVSINDLQLTEVYLSTGAITAIAAFAMQQTLGDLFSGIALSLEDSFRIGDWIVLKNGAEGEIIDIDWRSTKLRAWDNTTLVIPNGVLAREAIKNYHDSTHVFAPWYEVKIRGEIDPIQAKTLLSEAAARCDGILKNPPPSVRLINASTIPYIYSIWVHFPNYPSMFEGREQLYSEIHKTLEDAGIGIAPDIYEIRSDKEA